MDLPLGQMLACMISELLVPEATTQEAHCLGVKQQNTGLLPQDSKCGAGSSGQTGQDLKWALEDLPHPCCCAFVLVGALLGWGRESSDSKSHLHSPFQFNLAHS